jgi:hypothetical protein
MASELDVMKLIDDELTKIEDSSARVRVLRWAWEKFAGGADAAGAASSPAKGASKARTPKNGGGAPKPKAPTIVKDLDLKPRGKASFAEFAQTKNPTSHYERCLITVYYLTNIAEVSPVGVDHVYTCFKVMGWRVPADLRNAMQVAASTKGWLDTSNMSDIRVTVHGDNYVEHDLSTNDK